MITNKRAEIRREILKYMMRPNDQDPYYAFCYAALIIKKEWKSGEPYIIDTEFEQWYKWCVIEGNWMNTKRIVWLIITLSSYRD